MSMQGGKCFEKPDSGYQLALRQKKSGQSGTEYLKEDRGEKNSS